MRSRRAASSAAQAAGAAIVLCFVSVSTYLLWTLDRGFEITDEAYYLLLAMQPEATTLYISAQHWITSYLWQASGSLSAFRGLGLLVLVCAASLLAIGVHSAGISLGLFDGKPGRKAILIAGSALGAMLYASTVNLSPSYNLLAAAGAYAAGGLVLQASSCARQPQKLCLQFLAGSALAVEALCKASAGASTLALLTLWVIIFERACGQKMLGALGMVLGLAAFSLLALLATTTPAEASIAIEGGMALFRIVQTEAVDARLLRYAEQFGESLLSTLAIFALPLLAFLGYARTRSMLFVLAGMAILVATLVLGDHWLGGWDADRLLNEPFALCALLVAAFIFWVPLLRGSFKRASLIVGLILLPYSVAMGTGNMLFTQVIVSLAPWGALVAALVIAQPQAAWDPVPSALLGVCFFATLSAQIFTSGLRPYHLAASLHHQDRPLALDDLGVVRVDSRTFEFLQELQAAKRNCSIRPGETFLGLYNVPGVALALQSVPLTSPWLNNAAQADFLLERTRLDTDAPVVLAVNLLDRGALPPMPTGLERFPVDYRYCGTAIYPYRNQEIQIWRTRDSTANATGHRQ